MAWVWQNGAWTWTTTPPPTVSAPFQVKVYNPALGDHLAFNGSYWTNVQPESFLDGGGFDPFDGGTF